MSAPPPPYGGSQMNMWNNRGETQQVSSANHCCQAHPSENDPLLSQGYQRGGGTTTILVPIGNSPTFERPPSLRARPRQPKGSGCCCCLLLTLLLGLLASVTFAFLWVGIYQPPLLLLSCPLLDGSPATSLNSLGALSLCQGTLINPNVEGISISLDSSYLTLKEGAGKHVFLSPKFSNATTSSNNQTFATLTGRFNVVSKWWKDRSMTMQGSGFFQPFELDFESVLDLPVLLRQVQGLQIDMTIHYPMYRTEKQTFQINYSR